MLLLLVLLCLSGGTNAQFAEIASLATSLIGPALSGAGIAGTAGQAAGGAVGALGQIGQLYQLAQGALQLTGTGVGVLNQATEGNWFPAALEAAAKNQESIRKNGGGLGGGGLGGGGLGGGLGGLGGLMPLGPLGPAGGKTGGSAGVGPEFGTSFPAPDIDDYNEEIDLTSTTTTTAKPKSPFGSEEIEDKDLQSKTTTTAKPTTEASTVPVTLFPDEEEETSPTTLTPKKQIRIELPKEEEDYIDQVTKEGATEVEVTNREKQTEEDTLEPSPAPVVLSPKKTERGTEGVPNLEKLVTALKQKSSLTEEEIREIIGQVETNFNHDKPPKIDFGSGVQNINEKKASNRKRIIEASRRIDASNYHGQSHRKLSSVTLPPTTAPTPAPFVHSNTPTPDEILNNRLQREILAVGAGDKDLLSSRPVVQQKPFVPPTTVATSPPVVTFVYPPHPQVQPQPQPQLQPVQPQPHLQPQLPTQPQPQQYYYQHPTSFPIQQQTQQPHVQQPYYQQYQQQYYPQYYQQYQQQQYGQQYQQQYGQQQRQQAVVQPQQQVIQPQYHTQQQIVMSGTAQANRPVVQHQQQIQQVQQVHKVQGTRQMREGDVRPQRHVHTVSGQSTRIYTNQPAGAAFFVASNGSPVIRRQSPSPVRAQAARTIRRATPSPSQRRPFARTARTQPLTTPSPVRRVPARSNPANQH